METRDGNVFVFLFIAQPRGIYAHALYSTLRPGFDPCEATRAFWRSLEGSSYSARTFGRSLSHYPRAVCVKAPPDSLSSGVRFYTVAVRDIVYLYDCI